MLITSYKPDGEGHNHDLSMLSRWALFKWLDVPRDPISESLKAMYEYQNKIEKFIESEIKARLATFSIEDFMQIDIEVDEDEPRINIESTSATETKVVCRYNVNGIKIKPRKIPRTIEEAEKIYNLIHERR